jgi:calcium permeable stress-gated cation channel
MLAFSTVGLYFFYIANRYNMMFVNDSNIDTKGLIYPRALLHITTGMYLAMLCLIGLFAINQAPGPIVLMIAFLVASILFHVSLAGAVKPLLDTLPLDLEREEQDLLAPESGQGTADLESKAVRTESEAVRTESEVADGKEPAPAPQEKPNLFLKWLRPDRYSDYQTLRRLVPRDLPEIVYSADDARDAYHNPAISSQPPTLWIPRDGMGVSRQEVHHTSRVIPISDEDAGFDEKGKIHLEPDVRPPFYREKVYW